IRVAFDSDVKGPGSGRSAGDRVTAADRFFGGTMYRKVDVQVLTRTKGQRCSVHASKDKGHHVAGLGDGLHAFGQEFLWVPRTERSCSPGGCGGAVEDPVPRHLHAADSL